MLWETPTPLSEPCLTRTSWFLSCDPVATPPCCSIISKLLASSTLSVSVSLSVYLPFFCSCSRCHVVVLCTTVAVGSVRIWRQRSGDRGATWTMSNLLNQRLICEIVDRFQTVRFVSASDGWELEWGTLGGDHVSSAPIFFLNQGWN